MPGSDPHQNSPAFREQDLWADFSSTEVPVEVVQSGRKIYSQLQTSPAKEVLSEVTNTLYDVARVARFLQSTEVHKAPFAASQDRQVSEMFDGALILAVDSGRDCSNDFTRLCLAINSLCDVIARQLSDSVYFEDLVKLGSKIKYVAPELEKFLVGSRILVGIVSKFINDSCPVFDAFGHSLGLEDSDDLSSYLARCPEAELYKNVEIDLLGSLDRLLKFFEV